MQDGKFPDDLEVSKALIVKELGRVVEVMLRRWRGEDPRLFDSSRYFASKSIFTV